MDPRKAKKALEIYRRCAALPDDQLETYLETITGDDADVSQEVRRLIADGSVDPGKPSGLPAVGQTIGAYELRRKLGEGGMGLVFEASRKGAIRQQVALKVIKPGMDSREVLARFAAERQALALMNHPNIAKVLDAGTTDRGHPYFVMEYVAGVPLTDYCDRHNLGVEQRLQLFMQACAGVQHAHQKGVIHRDLKPSNILVQVRDDDAEVKIIDFGIARAINRETTEMSVFTEHGQLMGTPEYMSPEQAEMSNLDIDTRTDVYSLGVILYEMLVGRLPFEVTELRKAGLMEIRRCIREDEPHKPSTRFSALGEATTDIAKHRRTDPPSLNRLFRGDLDWITMKALDKDRTRRYGSASDLAADVGRFLHDEPVMAGPPSVGYRARKFVRRHRVAVGLSAAVAASLILGLTLATVGFVRAARAERVARFEADTSAEVIDFMVGLFQVSDPGEARGRSVTAYEILQRGVASIRGELDDRPTIQGRLLGVMALVYRSLGLHAEARPLFDSAIESQRRGFGQRSPEVAETMTALGGLLIQQRRHADARPFLEESLGIQTRALDAADPRLARTHNNLGMVARRAKDHDEALRQFEQALSIRQAAHGPESPEVAKQLGMIASLQRERGELAEARALYERAVTLARGMPDDDPQRALLLHNFGNFHRATEDFRAARRLLEEALAIREKILPPGHHHLLQSRVALGRTLAGLELLPQARAIFEQTLREGQDKLDDDHEIMLRALYELILVLQRLGEVDEAARLERLYEERRG